MEYNPYTSEQTDKIMKDPKMFKSELFSMLSRLQHMASDICPTFDEFGIAGSGVGDLCKVLSNLPTKEEEVFLGAKNMTESLNKLMDDLPVRVVEYIPDFATRVPPPSFIFKDTGDVQPIDQIRTSQYLRFPDPRLYSNTSHIGTDFQITIVNGRLQGGHPLNVVFTAKGSKTMGYARVPETSTVRAKADAMYLVEHGDVLLHEGVKMKEVAFDGNPACMEYIGDVDAYDAAPPPRPKSDTESVEVEYPDPNSEEILSDSHARSATSSAPALGPTASSSTLSTEGPVAEKKSTDAKDKKKQEKADKKKAKELRKQEKSERKELEKKEKEERKRERRERRERKEKKKAALPTTSASSVPNTLASSSATPVRVPHVSSKASAIPTSTSKSGSAPKSRPKATPASPDSVPNDQNLLHPDDFDKDDEWGNFVDNDGFRNHTGRGLQRAYGRYISRPSPPTESDKSEFARLLKKWNAPDSFWEAEGMKKSDYPDEVETSPRKRSLVKEENAFTLTRHGEIIPPSTSKKSAVRSCEGRGSKKRARDDDDDSTADTRPTRRSRSVSPESLP